MLDNEGRKSVIAVAIVKLLDRCDDSGPRVGDLDVDDLIFEDFVVVVGEDAAINRAPKDALVESVWLIPVDMLFFCLDEPTFDDSRLPISLVAIGIISWRQIL